jgi:hypothetical protein
MQSFPGPDRCHDLAQAGASMQACALHIGKLRNFCKVERLTIFPFGRGGQKVCSEDVFRFAPGNGSIFDVTGSQTWTSSPSSALSIGSGSECFYHSGIYRVLRMKGLLLLTSTADVLVWLKGTFITSGTGRTGSLKFGAWNLFGAYGLSEWYLFPGKLDIA